jgi:arylformamidase
MKIYDLSQLLDIQTKRFAEEPLMTLQTVLQKSESCPVNLTRISCSSHAGTHCDAPRHVDNDGATVCQLDLANFFGRCVVVDLSYLHQVITADDIKDWVFEERVLFKVYAVDLHFAYFDESAIELLASRGVKLIGTNALSVDAIDAKVLNAHHACYKNQIQIIEGLLLNDVLPGFYGFIGLPLKLSGADASPIRAIVFEGDFYA